MTLASTETVRPQLSDRQRSVLHHLCRGATDREIAASLFLSQRTVQREIGQLRGVFGVANRTELAAAVGALRRTAVGSGTAA